MQFVFYVGSFILGTIIGSFLNVFLLRFGTGKWKGGRSVCFSCGKNIPSLDLIPLFSFLFLGGRCRHCKTRISAQYPLVEILSGLIFLLVFYFFDSYDLFSLFKIVIWWAIYVFLLLIFIYDLRHKIIPEWPLRFLFVAVFFLQIFGNFSFRALSLVFLSGLVSSLPFLILWAVSSGRWIGFGDVKLAFPLGVMVGFKMVLPSIIFSYWIGGLFVILVFVYSRLGKFFGFKTHYVFNRKTELPFAPFLILGFLVILWFPEMVYPLFSFLR